MSIPLDIDQEVDLLGQINKVENSTHCVGSWASVSPGASFHRSIHSHSLVSSMPGTDSVTLSLRFPWPLVPAGNGQRR